jgi:peroxiredoxin
MNPQPAQATAQDFPEVLRQSRSQLGNSLAELSANQPVLVVFLRHAGCTFCREALDDVATVSEEIAGAGVKIAFVHMGTESAQGGEFATYGVGDVDRFSDPECELYKAFKLSRGRLTQLLSPRLWWRGFLAAIVNRHGFGRIVGDGFQMPGVFLLEKSKIIGEYRHQTAADRPDYVGLVRQHVASPTPSAPLSDKK